MGEDFKDQVAEELRRLDDKAKSPTPTAMDEEVLRKQLPSFHADPDKIKEYHSYLLLRGIEICNWCDWKNPNSPRDEGPSFNGVDLAEWKKRIEDPALYGSYSGKREQRVNEYFRGRELGLTHGDIRGLMGRRMNANTLDDYREVYEQWKSSQSKVKKK